MFLYGIILALIIGFVLKGNLKNLGNIELKGLYLVVIGFGMDAIMHFSAVYGVLKLSYLTYIFDLVMYILLAIFIYLNKKNVFVLIIGFGFLLNAIAIFSNGGAMPVSHSAMVKVAITDSTSSVGLYKLADSSTRFYFLCDIMSSKLLGKTVISIGDIISDIGIMALIITGMRGRKQSKLEA